MEAPAAESLVDTLITEARPAEVRLSLPRFEPAFELPLTTLITGMGMRRAFDPHAADFSAMLDPALGPLHLGFAVHKAFVKVDERGTEAAAATGVEAAFTSGPAEFRADHPFVYLIRDRLTGSILFLGRMEDPRAG